MTPRTEAGKFWDRVDASGDCWEWTGPMTTGGYGRMFRQQAHRVAYSLLVGPIPEGLTLDHLCRNKICVNPDHLEPLTDRENILRGYGPSAQQARRQSCTKGHPFTPENTARYGNHRKCLTCRLDNNAKPRSKRSPLRDRALRYALGLSDEAWRRLSPIERAAHRVGAQR